MYDYQNPTEFINKKVIVLDMDHTIIGECAILAEIDRVINTFRWTVGNKPPALSNAEIIEQLEHGLLRPGFIDFIQRIRKEQGYLVVVYTASVLHWANKMLNAICELVGYRFYCLLLTRFHCIPPFFDKSLYIVQSQLASIGIFRQPNDLVMIDNNPVMVDRRLILAPSYHWTPVVRVMPRILPQNLVLYQEKRYVYEYDLNYIRAGLHVNNHIYLEDTFFKTLDV